MDIMTNPKCAPVPQTAEIMSRHPSVRVWCKCLCGNERHNWEQELIASWIKHWTPADTLASIIIDAKEWLDDIEQPVSSDDKQVILDVNQLFEGKWIAFLEADPAIKIDEVREAMSDRFGPDFAARLFG